MGDPAALMLAQENFTEPEPSPNILYPLFDRCLKRLHQYIPQLSDLVINYQSDFKSIRQSHVRINKPFGQIRLHCLELLTISADFAQTDPFDHDLPETNPEAADGGEEDVGPAHPVLRDGKGQDAAARIRAADGVRHLAARPGGGRCHRVRLQPL